VKGRSHRSSKKFLFSLKLTKMASRFSVVQVGPPIEVFAVNKAYLDDTFDLKVNLSVGGKVM
jgi:hypothetical protein